MQNKNVYGGPLHIHSTSPPTGYYRDGFCRTGKEDSGNHTIAAVMTKEFLDFTASKGNNLSSAGVQPGTKWCLCATRWREAMKAAKDANDPIVPKVQLHSTATEALRDVDLKDLKKFAAEQETSGALGSTSPRGMAGPQVGTADKAGGSVRSQHPEIEEHPDRPRYPKPDNVGKA